LDHGFTSVEADVFLVQGKLLVAHDITAVRPERTLAALYLDPLRQRIKNQDGWIYDKGRSLTLLVDIKSDAETTYAALHKLLTEYAEVLTTVDDGKLETKGVTVVISGNRPRATITAQKLRYAGIDGRHSDLNSNLPADLLPLISDNWRNHFQWTGAGPLAVGERDKLHEIVKQAHAKGRRVRFWATPESTAVWKELRTAGVDLINTDDLDGLQKFLTAESETDN
jgi:glycerophosphoryl diester phosphodiesterase